jgi:hypothetical protein
MLQRLSVNPWNVNFYGEGLLLQAVQFVLRDLLQCCLVSAPLALSAWLSPESLLLLLLQSPALLRLVQPRVSFQVRGYWLQGRSLLPCPFGYVPLRRL